MPASELSLQNRFALWLDTRPGVAWSVLVLFAAALVLRMLPVIFWPESAYPDETIQSIEQAHRLLFGYGLVPWEFEFAARSWLLAYFSAGFMLIAAMFGDGPAYYLPAIGFGFATLSAATVVCAFLWARRLYSTGWAFLAVLVPLIWVDNLFFGARALTEVVATHFLVIALYLLFPGEPVLSRRRIFAGGFFLAAVFVLRMQLAPAVLVVCLWNLWDGSSRRVTALPLFLGFAAGLLCDGIFDALTWHYPFQPLVMNFTFNLLKGVASSFGTNPWWFYCELFAGLWGPVLVLMIPLILIGARRMPVLFVTALVIFAAHCLIPHKDYRFIYPAIVLWTILAGQGLAQAGIWIADGIGTKTTDKNRAALLTGTSVAVCWIGVCGILYNGLDYALQWGAPKHDIALADRYLANAKGICGIDLYGVDDWAAPYAFIHQRVPIYRSFDAARLQWKPHRGPFNVMLVNSQLLPDATFRAAASVPWRHGGTTSEIISLNAGRRISTIQPATIADYTPERCFGTVCVLRRSGTCESVPMTKAPAPSIVTQAPPYPQKQGVLD